jgi:uncharacterized repeat protein (TIGR03803 family)
VRHKKFFAVASAALIIVVATFLLAPAALAAGKYKSVHRFDGGKEGGYPTTRLTFDQAGNLYGTAFSGGANGAGSVFKLTPNADGSWAESTLYSFPSGANNYAAGVVFDQAGNLYGTTTGGKSGNGAVFELIPNPDGSWSEKTLYSFMGGSDGSSPNGPLIFDADGNIYGVTFAGGSEGNGTVFELTPNLDGSWTENTLYSFSIKGGGYPETGVIFDADGNLYGTLWTGGKCGPWGCGVVYKLSRNADGSWTESVLHKFCSLKKCRDGENPYAGLTFDRAGNLYGTTYGGGAHGKGVVFEMTPNSDGTWTETVLHHFTGGKDGASPYNSGVIFDQTGNLYGTAFKGGTLSDCDGKGCGVVFKLAPNSSGGWTETVVHAFAGRPGANPVGGLMFDALGNLFGTTSGSANWGSCSGARCGSVFEITP